MDTNASLKAELARQELRGLLLGRYGKMTAVAEALDVPYKSVIRYLSSRTTEQRDVPLWFLITALQRLGVPLTEFMQRVEDQAARITSEK